MKYLVQTGLLGEISLFRSPDNGRYERDEDVVCRTNRGLEVGRVVTDSPEGSVMADSSPAASGTLLRRITREDRMILSRIDKFKDRAFLACEKLLRERNVPGILVDVEHLFDGESVYFYFLGDVPESINSISTELTEIYDSKVKFRQFTELLAKGCGPGCGTTASKCGENGGCSSCSISGGCGSSNVASQVSADQPEAGSQSSTT